MYKLWPYWVIIIIFKLRPASHLSTKLPLGNFHKSECSIPVLGCVSLKLASSPNKFSLGCCKIVVSLSIVADLQLLDVVIKWKHFPRYWPFVRVIYLSPMNSPYKGRWLGALIFSLICAWTNDCVNNRDAGYLICHRAHYDATVMRCGAIKFRTQITSCDGIFYLYPRKCDVTKTHLGSWPIVTTECIEARGLQSVPVYCRRTVDTALTHWSGHKMANISQTTFSNAIPWMKVEDNSTNISLEFVPKCQINNYNRSNHTNVQYNNISSDNGLAPTRRQAIIWTNDGKFTDTYVRHWASVI